MACFTGASPAAMSISLSGRPGAGRRHYTVCSEGGGVAPALAGSTVCQLAVDHARNEAKMAGMNIQLDRSKPVPLARQIEAEIERLIQARLLAPGVKLPATRELAETLGVNRATVSLA